MRRLDDEAPRSAHVLGHAFDVPLLRRPPARHDAREAASGSMPVRRAAVEAQSAEQRRERGQRHECAHDAYRRNDRKKERKAEAIQRGDAPIAHGESCGETPASDGL